MRQIGTLRTQQSQVQIVGSKMGRRSWTKRSDGSPAVSIQWGKLKHLCQPQSGDSLLPVTSVTGHRAQLPIAPDERQQAPRSRPCRGLSNPAAISVGLRQRENAVATSWLNQSTHKFRFPMPGFPFRASLPFPLEVAKWIS